MSIFILMFANLFELLYLLMTTICFNYLLYSILNEKTNIKISLIIGTLLLLLIYYFNIGVPGLDETIVKKYLLHFLFINIISVLLMVIRRK